MDDDGTLVYSLPGWPRSTGEQKNITDAEGFQGRVRKTLRRAAAVSHAPLEANVPP
jgi:hypothetical protein